jgi:DNA-binding NarL/FixJ family response regulator
VAEEGIVIKILIADDHAVVRRGIREILEDTPDLLVGAEAATAGDVLRLVRDQRWDVIVLDVHLPGANGLDLLHEVRRERPEMRVLVLTGYPEEQYALRAIKAGAMGFLTKESAPEKLVDAVRKIASGGRYVGDDVAQMLASAVAGDASGAPHERLSNREFEVLRILASGRTVSQVAEHLSLSVKTVSTHRTRILQKMGMKTNAELTHYAIRNKLVD